FQSYDDSEEYAEIHNAQQPAYFYSAPCYSQPYHQNPAQNRAHFAPHAAQPSSHRFYEGQRIKLHPVSELPDMYRAIFKFGVFNAVQSSCFDDASLRMIIPCCRQWYGCPPFHFECPSLVYAAPTGSGKTVLFELAIIKMLKEANDKGQKWKCVYIAPTKALCGERYRDWSNKFDPLDIKCCQLTGDTVHFGKDAWVDAKNASIMFGEKWDSLTRNWASHRSILASIRLFLVDEVHILNESRGSTLEVVVSRMKLRGSSVRFIVVSATVPNIQDIASWIGSIRGGGRDAKVFEFGEDFRPCKLTRHVIGVPRQKGQNDFVFSKNLDYKLFGALQMHSAGKPILVFVATRKGVFATAQQLAKDYKEAEGKKLQSLPWTKPARYGYLFGDKALAELAALGIGVHHAGMTLDDRRAMEDLYIKRILRVMVATSTLAVGVNLPAHTVVIKGVHTFQNNATVEYSDLDIMQMLGRAGRPQFDKEGVALIICEAVLEHKYRNLVQGESIVESSLQNNLAEHLNSEIGLGTITSVTSAKEWLKSSFLYRRIQKNPSHYSIDKGDNQTWEEKIDDIVTGGVQSLRDSELIMQVKDGDKETLLSTEFGDIMSRFYIRQNTMRSILALSENPSLRDVVYNKLRKHNDIRFEVSKIEKTADKVFTLIQAVLGGVWLNDPEYKTGDSQIHLEAFSVFRHLPRIARAVVEVAIVRKRGAQLKYGLELLRCFTAKAWENRPVSLKQLESIGEKSCVLTEHGITSLEILRKQDTLRLEALLNRRPPFGLQLLAAVKEFPLYSLKVVEKELYSGGGKKPVEVILGISCGLLEAPGDASSKVKKTKPTRFANMTVVLTLTSDNQFIDFRRIPTKALNDEKHFELEVSLDKPSLSVVVYVVSDVELEGLEDCSDLFDMEDIDSNGDEIEPRQEKGTKPVASKNFNKAEPSITSAAKVREKEDNVKTKSSSVETVAVRCHHSCRDKATCRHLCCREGTVKPSKSQPSVTQKSSQPSTKTKQTPSKPKPTLLKPIAIKPNNSQRTHAKCDRTLEELEKLHKETSVEENLNMPKGHRLKLDFRPQASRSIGNQTTGRKKKPMPNPDFNIQFSEIKNMNQDGLANRALSDLSDDDDLPEVDRIFSSLGKAASQGHKRKQSSNTAYSDTEVDALIRDLPEEDARGEDKTLHTAIRYSPRSSPSKRLKTSKEVIIILS
ncbi:P-loop containing nucleoside triphosphate hydrolase protein, partial [Marasmius fiardii PR-910]